jgi:hypothetical protein
MFWEWEEMKSAEQWCFSIGKISSAAQRCFSIVKARLSEMESSSYGGGNLQNICSVVFL